LAAGVFLKLLRHSFYHTTESCEKHMRIKMYLKNPYKLFNVMGLVPVPYIVPFIASVVAGCFIKT